MKIITNLLTSLVLAIAVGAIAILSVQNATLVSLRLLSFESIQLPVGVVLAFSAGVGVIGGTIAPLFSQVSGSQQNNQQFEDNGEYDDVDF
ncbi:MAG: LapA family protein [Aphanothece sp. CMT-3BRIN-NPC111]|jgi:uncharacterized integral membrane protein|nr:LapA family protein [Aphanothece sp. CMT-3BRIN-NPC111]